MVTTDSLRRARFESIDENMDRIDAAYDHYAKTLQSALNGCGECVLATDISDEDCERYATALKKRISEYGDSSEP